MTVERLQVAFITGRSNPDCWSLSQAQSGFLAQLAAPGRRLVNDNFPYGTNSAPYLPEPLLRASVNNAREYLMAQTAEFKRQYRRGVIALLEQAPQTVFLAGSCGLELFNRLDLPPDWLARIAVFAYGPVAWRRPACRSRMVQGHRDLVSRLWFRRADEYVDGGHLDYLTRPRTLVSCEAFIRSVEVETGAHDEIS